MSTGRDLRTKRQKLQAMAERGTEHERAVARAMLERMGPEQSGPNPIPRTSTSPFMSPEDIEAAMRDSDPFVDLSGDILFNGDAVGNVRTVRVKFNARRDPGPFGE